ncbi:MAG: VirB3 family type IV secretion system protein [Alphaproteobacteria bacterium]|nr:VirB3 family type IV secretion system protein [Alphaproteobacteria bacterium]
MKQQVLKALANPALLFYVPYSLAVINFAVQFIIYMILFIGSLIVSKGTNPISPLFFLLSVIGVHMFMMLFAKKDPQLGQIVSAKIQLFKKRIPNRLAA